MKHLLIFLLIFFSESIMAQITLDSTNHAKESQYTNPCERSLDRKNKPIQQKTNSLYTIEAIKKWENRIDTLNLIRLSISADLINEAKVIKKKVEWNETFNMPVTIYTLEVFHNLKGEQQEYISFMVRGGGNLILSHSVSYRVGATGIFFLKYYTIKGQQFLLLNGNRALFKKYNSPLMKSYSSYLSTNAIPLSDLATLLNLQLTKIPKKE